MGPDVKYLCVIVKKTLKNSSVSSEARLSSSSPASTKRSLNLGTLFKSLVSISPTDLIKDACEVKQVTTCKALLKVPGIGKI